MWATSGPQNSQIWSKTRILAKFWILILGSFTYLTQFFFLKITIIESWHNVEHILLTMGAKIQVLKIISPYLQNFKKSLKCIHLNFKKQVKHIHGNIYIHFVMIEALTTIAIFPNPRKVGGLVDVFLHT